MGHIFAVHHDGSLSLFGDTKKWCHTFSKDMSILSFNKVAKSHGCCDVILVVSEVGLKFHQSIFILCSGSCIMNTLDAKKF